MDDLRDNLVDLILKANDAVEAVLEEARSMEYTYKDLCSIEADYMITNGVTVQEWISVKDRLPENMDDRVLVLLPTKSYDYPIGNQHIDTDRYRGEYRKWVRYGDKVTHWMPLPQPPKEE